MGEIVWCDSSKFVLQMRPLIRLTCLFYNSLVYLTCNSPNAARDSCRDTFEYIRGCIRSSSSPIWNIFFWKKKKRNSISFRSSKSKIVSFGTAFKAGNISLVENVAGVSNIVRKRWVTFLFKNPARFNRARIYWPHKHLPWNYEEKKHRHDL